MQLSESGAPNGRKARIYSGVPPPVMFYLRLAVSVLLVSVLVYRIDINDLSIYLSRISPAWLIIAGSFLALLGLVQARRWQFTIRASAGALSYLSAYRIILVGLFFNQTLPSTIGGDAFRVVECRRLGLKLRTAANSVIVDRLFSLAALFVMTTAALPMILPRLSDSAAKVGVVATPMVIIIGFAILLSADHIPWLPAHWRVTKAARSLSSDARRMFLNTKMLALGLSLSIIVQMGMISVVFGFGLILEVDVGFVDYLVLVPPAFLASAVPISLAGWGTREAAMVVSFGLAGVASSEALAMSILFGIAAMAAGVPGGLIWLVGRRRGGANVASDEPHSLSTFDS